MRATEQYSVGSHGTYWAQKNTLNKGNFIIDTHTLALLIPDYTKNGDSANSQSGATKNGIDQFYGSFE